jgi:hypothetical protein
MGESYDTVALDWFGELTSRNVGWVFLIVDMMIRGTYMPQGVVGRCIIGKCHNLLSTPIPQLLFFGAQIESRLTLLDFDDRTAGDIHMFRVDIMIVGVSPCRGYYASSKDCDK